MKAWMQMVGVALLLLGFTVVSQAALEPGRSLPKEVADVEMLNVDGGKISITQAKGAKGTLVIFTCNHCPYVKAWEERMTRIGNAAQSRGIGVIMINSNDPATFPEDRYEVMIDRAQDRGFKFPYVVDETSQAARVFGATKTPECFLFDNSDRLVYAGTVDNNAFHADQVTKRYLEEAVEALLAGQAIPLAKTKGIGCSIKFRQDA